MTHLYIVQAFVDRVIHRFRVVVTNHVHHTSVGEYHLGKVQVIVQ